MSGTDSDAALEVLSRLSVRDRMTEFCYFVGRQQTIHSLIGCAMGPSKRSAVWIHGPRRLGKSSLAARLASIAETNGTLVVWVDAGDIASNDFEGLLDRTAARASRHIELEEESPRERFESLAARSSDQPVLVVFDEFDHIASNLDTPRQAFLRRLKSENDLFCYIFVTRLDPALIMEEVPDHNSRLSAICNHHRIKPIAEADVHELCRRVGNDLRIPEATAWARLIFQAVGGYSYAVTWLVKEISVEAQDRALDAEAVREIVESRRREVDADLRYYWGDLRSGTRSLLLHGSADRAGALYSEDARADGYLADKQVIRPAWLVEVGKDVGLAPRESFPTAHRAATAPVEHIQRLIHAINSHLERRGLPPGFELPGEKLRYFLFTRADVSITVLATAVEHLCRIMIDGSRSIDGRCWRLPTALAEVLEQSESYRALLLLRGALAGSGAAPRPGPKGGEEEVREVYARLSGVSSPSTREHWGALLRGLLDRIIATLEAMERISRDGQLRGPVRIAYQCADADWDLLEELDRHLAELKRDGHVEVMHERQFQPGANREEERERQAQRAELILVLLSASYLSSDSYDWLLNKERSIIMILIRAIESGAPSLRKHQMLPRNRTPVSSRENRDEAWSEIVGELRSVIAGMRKLEGV
ncbi:hypothetical protein [Sorangium sp. So ce117]|uniref:hypothetical protein n=1 Tax=Sorangium sp. So ce117 TaxID=3133277 RepID=UPI003F61B662